MRKRITFLLIIFITKPRYTNMEDPVALRIIVILLENIQNWKNGERNGFGKSVFMNLFQVHEGEFNFL